MPAFVQSMNRRIRIENISNFLADNGPVPMRVLQYSMRRTINFQSADYALDPH